MIVVCDAETGRIVRHGRAAHPEAREEADLGVWWEGFRRAATAEVLTGVAALGVAGQRHAVVMLDGRGAPVSPVFLQDEMRAAAAAADLTDELGGPDGWLKTVGFVPRPAYTVAVLRWFARSRPELADRVAMAVAPHDWLTWRLLGGPPEITTDRAGASGTGCWCPFTGQYREDLAQMAFGRPIRLPRLIQPNQAAGSIPDLGVVITPGTSEEAAAALGLGLGPGDAVISIGAAGTVIAVADVPCADPAGTVVDFADATGRHLPQVTVLNAAAVLMFTAAVLGTDLTGLDTLAMQSTPGAHGLVFLPYLDGEQVPALPHASGTLTGLRAESMAPAHVARAAVEGMLCGLADGLDALRWAGADVSRVVLIGKAARTATVQTMAPLLFGVPVFAPEPVNYIALGAARQAAWILSGQPSPPSWPGPQGTLEYGTGDLEVGLAVREQYRGARERLHPELASHNRPRRGKHRRGLELEAVPVEAEAASLPYSST